jgi:hypothetical protein
MFGRLLVLGAAVSAIATFAIASQPARADSCTVVAAEGRGANEAKATARAQKHLTFKINRWARKNGYATVGVAKPATVCAEKGALVHCTVSARVCG